MILSDLSIKRPIFATVMMLALLTLGLFSYKRLGVEMFPNVEFPIVSIITTFPGASPETVEREVSKRLEDSVNQIAGVKHVFSTSREGVSTVTVQFQLEQKLKGAEHGREFERAAKFGRTTPDLWMVNATGAPLSSAPMLKAAEAALVEEEEKAP